MAAGYNITKGSANGGAAKKESPRQRVKDMMVKYKSEIQMALPKYVDADRLIRVTLTALNKNPKLFEATPASLLGALIQSAQLNLDPGDALGLAYLVPFNKSFPDGEGGWRKELQVQLIIGYRGLMELVRRTGKVNDIVANYVVARDDFSYEYGTDHFLRHKPTVFGEDIDAEDITHFYAYAHLKEGGFQFVVMPKYQVDKVMCDAWRKNNPRQKRLPDNEVMSKVEGVWKDHYIAMGMKTAVRQLSKWLPMTQEDTALKIGLENAELTDRGKATVYDLDNYDKDLKELPVSTDDDVAEGEPDKVEEHITAGAGKVVEEEKPEKKKPAAKKKASKKKDEEPEDEGKDVEGADALILELDSCENEKDVNTVVAKYRDQFSDWTDEEYQKARKAIDKKATEIVENK